MQQANESENVQYVSMGGFTWSNMLPLMLHIATNSRTDRQTLREIKKEFENMARAADLYNKHANSGKCVMDEEAP